MLSDNQACELPTSFSFYSYVTMDGNPAFTVHATAHDFRAAINLNNMLLRQHIFGTRKAEVLNSLIINTTAKANDTTDILQTFR